jgi:hypothetical protein
MNLRLDEAEYEVLYAAAARVGLTPTGYAAAAAVAAARGGSVADQASLRNVQLELMQAHTQLRRFSTNVNQAVAALNATGQAPEWLESAVALCRRVSQRLFELIERIDRQLR